MTATLNELAQETHRVLEPVLQGQTVTLTRHGKPVAEILPHEGGATNAELARIWETPISEADRAAILEAWEEARGVAD